MTETLLSTKFFIPPNRPKLVPRQRLMEILSEGLHRKLTLICAPAGFGKTTLVTEWWNYLRQEDPKKEDLRLAWLSLSEDDNDLVRFLTYFIAALNHVKERNPPSGREL